MAEKGRENADHKNRDRDDAAGSKDSEEMNDPTDLEGSSMLDALKRAFTEFQEDNMTDKAASLVYYGLLSLFPALIAFVGIIGFFADPQEATSKLTDIVSSIGPASAADTFKDPIQSVASNSGASGIVAIVGIVAALWSASGYTGAFMRASNVIYETPEGRPFWKLRPLQMLVTFVMMVLLLIVVFGVALTGPVVEQIAGPLGVGDQALTIWSIAKWPVMALIVITIISVLYYAAPNVKQEGYSWVSWGGAFALVVWLIASAAFAFYVANFGSYNETYGTLGGAVVFLMWLWITNIALLLGAELNAELERSRQIEEGVAGAREQIQLEPRDEPDEAETVGGKPEGGATGTT